MMLSAQEMEEISNDIRRHSEENCVALEKIIEEMKKEMEGGDDLGTVVKKRRKKMRKHKHRKNLKRTRHLRRKQK